MMDRPTSPVTTPEIEAVFGDAQSVAVQAAPAPSMVGEWRRLGAFLRRPRLDVRAQNEAPLTVIARIYALDMAIMLVLILAASVAVALGVYLPETALAGIEFTPIIVALVVIGAPVMEELVFRGWLSGRPQHMLALAATIAGFVGFGLVHRSGMVTGLAVMGAGALLAALALTLLRNRGPMRWFSAIFPLLFWIATLSFALVHLANFDKGSLAVLLPLVLPQLVLGMLVGYLRVRIGLWAAILLHAAHNATALTIAGLAMLVTK
jgi:membrane protease YdiL (CAAX protease family)